MCSYDEMIQEIRKEVSVVLRGENSGHGLEHAERVAKLACDIAKREGAFLVIVELAALLHDVDDYKLFGKSFAENLTNARHIMNVVSVPKAVSEYVLDVIRTVGYSKRLNGIVPETLEAKVVSDADMLDIMGVTGILRIHQYNLAKGRPFFDPSIWPVLNMSADEYMKKKDGTAVNHMFEKILKLADMMQTMAGKEMALPKKAFMITFLQEFFHEQNVPEWSKYLTEYLKV